MHVLASGLLAQHGVRQAEAHGSIYDPTRAVCTDHVFRVVVKSACHMQALYSSVNGSAEPQPGGAAAEANASSSVNSVTTVKGTLCVFPFTYQDASYTTCMAPQGSGSG